MLKKSLRPPHSDDPFIEEPPFEPLDVLKSMLTLSNYDDKKTIAFPTFETQFINFFKLCYGNDLEISQEKCLALRDKGIMFWFSVDTFESKSRLTRQRIKKMIQRLQAVEKELQVINFTMGGLWYPGEYKKDAHYLIITRPLNQSCAMITRARNFFSKILSNLSTGGLPKDLNLELLLGSLADIFIPELYDAWVNNRIKKDLKALYVEPFNRNFDRSIKICAVDEYIVTLISNFLEATGIRPNVSGLTIWRYIQSNAALKKNLKAVSLYK